MSIELTKGQVAWQKAQGRLYEVLGGLGSGKVVRLYQVSNQGDANAVVTYLRDLRSYPEGADELIRWLRVKAATTSQLPVRDYEYESITQASTTSNDGAAALAVNREEVAHGNPGDS